MPRYGYGGKQTCESCKSLDIRRLHRDNFLRAGHRFSWAWSRNGEPTGNIVIEAEQGEIVLLYRTRSRGASEWREIRQCIPITWTRCNLGGRRPWFVCSVHSNARFCGRRVAILYAAGDLFACRHCYRLAYASQSENSRDRSLTQAQNIRMRLGGGPSIIEPFPEKPLGMHWRTYYRLRAKAMALEGHSLAFVEAYLARRSMWR
jgi:hypothetical protein